MTSDIEIIKGLHSIQHDVLRIVTVSKTVHELIPRYDPVIREKIRVLKTQISDKAVLILIDYMEHVLDNGIKSGFCDMANLIESMINAYLEVDEPVKIEEESHNQETKPYPPKENNGNNKVYRIMNKKHKIKRYKSGCVYDLILEYLVKNLPVDFLKSDVQTLLGDYYEKAKLKVPIDSSLNTYAGLYIRCGKEANPPVFKRTGNIGKGRGKGRHNAKYRKTGEKLQSENIEFDKKIVSEPVKKEKDTDGEFNIHVVDKFTQRKKADPTPKIEKPIGPKKKPEEEIKETEPEENIKNKSDDPDPIEPIPTGDSSFSLKIKKKKTEEDIVDFQGLSFPDQIYMYAEKSGWIGLKRDISFLVIKRHFSDKTIAEIEDAVQKLIIGNKVTQTGSGRINFKGDKNIETG